MKYILIMKMPIEKGNEAIKDPGFGQKMNDLLTEINAESVYYTTICGRRGAYIIVNLNEASEIPNVLEPFYLWLNAEVDIYPVITPEAFAKAGPSIESSVNKWG